MDERRFLELTAELNSIFRCGIHPSLVRRLSSWVRRGGGR